MKHIFDIRMESKSLKRVAALAALVGVSLGFSGCATTGHHEDRGALAGAAAGAVLGTIIGNQSGEPGEGAAVGAVAGALIGRELGRKRDQADLGAGRPRSPQVYDATRVDYGDLMTDEEKRTVLERSGENSIVDWGDHLTPAEKRRLLDRAESTIGL